ncbi:copper transport protein CCH [Selaginella moellendorffii]|uniref:copper transport protein CCH n=1 Tax=Selaginella moellendorffii TaxID=88036 RepID=UPI000D1CAB1F|nr:copper transport protein CCH [Selaginella moellendorffii]XP_024530519.1 copper transport protein CCH [Selaginella moellendorffii]XP_024530520.1 copper transport protein CCH [Selaginella moellendorffii]XP_024530521.1 copper transport protein CCH [Selaginella moellendorffii]XP_024530523.1 copper transport protein CCH [Selaginella moellendorffii]XP_024530524.1 copper transport protein CCH [Selaginella moellendorffii]|eukprot:XP_002969798.2 copper transport protein CCH [Selaginella moellendorffii]
MPEPQTVVIKVRMHCEGCRKKVKKALSKIPGIQELKVDLKEQKVTIKGDVDIKKVLLKLARTGKMNEVLQPASAPAEPNKPKESSLPAAAAAAGETAAQTPAPAPAPAPSPARSNSAPTSLATSEAATKEAILRDIQMKPLVWIDAPDFLSDENPNACSVM